MIFRGRPGPKGDPGTSGEPGSGSIALEKISDIRARLSSSTSMVVKGHTSAGDGGGGVFYWSDIAVSDDGGTVINAGGVGASEAGWRRIYDRSVDITWFGAKGDGVTDDTAAINTAIDVIHSHGGGIVNFPSGTYYVSPQGAGDACITVKYDNIHLRGSGEASVIKTAVNSHTPIYVCSQPDTTVPAADYIRNCSVKDLKIVGTGVYEFLGMTSGRGINAKYAKYLDIVGNTVLSMSMIGICVELGTQGVNVHSNWVRGCSWGGINFNGPVFQSKVTNNIVSDVVDAGLNCSGIETTGHCVVDGNTIYNCSGSGIAWGEGDYHSLGVISNNLIKKCSHKGIWVAFHGPVSVISNVICNCHGGAGISMEGNTLSFLTVATDNCVVTNNLLVNNYPFQIISSIDKAVVTNNVLLYLASPTNPHPTYISPSNIEVRSRPEGAIEVYGKNCIVKDNIINGFGYGISVWPIGNTTNIIKSNKFISGSLANQYFWSADWGYYALPIYDGVYESNGYIQEVYSTSSVPIRMSWKNGDVQHVKHSTSGSFDIRCNFNLETTTILESSASADTLYVVSNTGVMVGDSIIRVNSSSLAGSVTQLATVVSTGSDGTGSFVTFTPTSSNSTLSGSYVNFYRMVSERDTITVNTINVDTIVFTSASSTSQLLGTSADGALSVGVILGSSASYSTAGSKLLSIRNNNVEKANVSYDGSLSYGISNYGSYINETRFSELVSITGSNTFYTVNQVPAGAQLQAVAARVIDSFQTASVFAVGISSSVWDARSWSYFGGGTLSGTAGITNTTSSIAPEYIYCATDTPIWISASVLQGNAPITGNMRVECYYKTVNPLSS